MRPKFLAVKTIFDADHWRAGKEFHISAFRDTVGAKAEKEHLAIIGHELLEFVWLVQEIEDGKIVYKSRNEDNHPTHVQVIYRRQCVSRKVRL